MRREYKIMLHTEDLMFLLVEKRLWNDLAGSVSPSLSEESSPAEGADLVETTASFPAIWWYTPGATSSSSDLRVVNKLSPTGGCLQLTKDKRRTKGFFFIDNVQGRSESSTYTGKRIKRHTVNWDYFSNSPANRDLLNWANSFKNEWKHTKKRKGEG